MKEELLKKLIAWGLAHGATLPEGVTFESCEIKGIRCICNKDVVEAALKIPKDLIISSRLVPSEFPGVAIDKDSNTWLKFFLSKLRYSRDDCISGLNEKFKPYLECLPAIVDSPLVWNPKELLLLGGTNLGNSINLKLYAIMKEWYSFVRANDIVDREEISDDCDVYENFHNLPRETIFDQLIVPLTSNSSPNWYSFAAFLWAHLMLISRAFPEYIIDKDVDPTSVMLLPVIDLLNHDYHSEVEWSFANDEFGYRRLESIKSGQELYNNYGCKGNEELLSGYGFVLDENIFDYVALKIKLPTETITHILEHEPEIKLPTIDDYTTFAFEQKKKKEENGPLKSSFDDGVTYFINRTNDACLNPLLDIFAYLCNRPGTQNWSNLTARFKGIQSLRNALEYKLETVIEPPRLASGYSEFGIAPYRSHCSKIYRSGQIHVLKYALNKLKTIEKALLTENKSNLLTMKKVLKYDTRFCDKELPEFFQGNNQDDIVFESNFELLVIWILLKIRNDSFEDKHGWVACQYQDFIKQVKAEPEAARNKWDPAIKILHSRISNSEVVENAISLPEVYDAFEFVERNSFTRIASSNPETIMVKKD